MNYITYMALIYTYANVKLLDLCNLPASQLLSTLQLSKPFLCVTFSPVWTLGGGGGGGEFSQAQPILTIFVTIVTVS